MSRFRLCFSLVALFLAIMVISLPGQSALAQDATPVAGAPDAVECPPLTLADAEAWGERYFAPWNAGDASQLADLVVEDYVHHWGIGGDVTGRDAYIASVDEFLRVFADVNFVVDEALLANNETVILRWTATGTQTDAFRGVSASDVQTTWTGINIMRIDCDQIVEGWGEADHFGRLEQQGVIGEE
jgi:steroid delta-isomerase-like uncharacterized protein